MLFLHKPRKILERANTNCDERTSFSREFRLKIGQLVSFSLISPYIDYINVFSQNRVGKYF